jgi:hypothetical protein
VKINALLESGTEGLGSIKHDIMNKINDPKIPMYGELEPSGWETSLKSVSHVVKDATIQDESLYADIVLLDTDNGNLLKQIMEYTNSKDFTTAPFNVSARYMGSVDPAVNGGTVTVTKLLTYDIIPDTPEQIKKKRIESRKRKIASILKEDNKDVNNTDDISIDSTEEGKG